MTAIIRHTGQAGRPPQPDLTVELTDPTDGSDQVTHNGTPDIESLDDPTESGQPAAGSFLKFAVVVAGIVLYLMNR